MYVLQMEENERRYVVSLLNAKQSQVASKLATQLAKADDAFGIVWWTDKDIARLLKQKGIRRTRKNIATVRRSYYARHIDDALVQSGWDVLEQATAELRRRSQ